MENDKANDDLLSTGGAAVVTLDAVRAIVAEEHERIASARAIADSSAAAAVKVARNLGAAEDLASNVLRRLDTLITRPSPQSAL